MIQITDAPLVFHEFIILFSTLFLEPNFPNHFDLLKKLEDMVANSIAKDVVSSGLPYCRTLDHLKDT